MLSYMLPVEEKPPLGPPKGHHLHLLLGSESTNNGKHANSISKENSISSFLSDGTTTTISQNSMTPTSCSEKSKPKLANGTKHQQPLKRVSFGSSKGSMVETLIYENRIQDDAQTSPIAEHPAPTPSASEKNETEREKVRVTFFQQSKPQEVDLPDEPPLFCSPHAIMEHNTANEIHHTTYAVHQSVENGWDNPFRPGGDLSKEADEIVELIKGGKPITPTSGTTPTLVDDSDAKFTNSRAYAPITESPKKTTATSLNAAPQSANGKVKNEKVTSPGSVDVQRGTVMPAGNASEVEHVIIKKKPKCKCCVIQ